MTEERKCIDCRNWSSTLSKPVCDGCRFDSNKPNWEPDPHAVKPQYKIEFGPGGGSPGEGPTIYSGGPGAKHWTDDIGTLPIGPTPAVSCATCAHYLKGRGVCTTCDAKYKNWTLGLLELSALRPGAIHFAPEFPKPEPKPAAPDMVNHPPHYTSHPSGVECIQVTEHYNFCVGNAIKYLWRAGLKGSGAKGIEDLQKACWYIEREIERLDAELLREAITSATPTGEFLADPVQGQTK